MSCGCGSSGESRLGPRLGKRPRLADPRTPHRCPYLDRCMRWHEVAFRWFLLLPPFSLPPRVQITFSKRAGCALKSRPSAWESGLRAQGWRLVCVGVGAPGWGRGWSAWERGLGAQGWGWSAWEQGLGAQGWGWSVWERGLGVWGWSVWERGLRAGAGAGPRGSGGSGLGAGLCGSRGSGLGVSVWAGRGERRPGHVVNMCSGACAGHEGDGFAQEVCVGRHGVTGCVTTVSSALWPGRKTRRQVLSSPAIGTLYSQPGYTLVVWC